MAVVYSGIHLSIKRSPMHIHDYFEIIYCLSGTSEATINGQTYSLASGDFYLVPPNVPHGCENDQYCSEFVVDFDSIDLKDVLVLRDKGTDILQILQLIHRTTIKKDQNYRNIANSLTDALCNYIESLTLSTNESEPVCKLKNTLLSNIENIDFDLTEGIKSIGYHPDYIRRCFKEETGKTPLEYLTNLRLKRAKKLLVMNSFESIEHIAIRCGFRDPFYFSTCFKKHTGTSPLQYRKQNLSSDSQSSTILENSTKYI